MSRCPPVIVDPPAMTAGAARSFNWFTVAAIGTWIVCAVWPVGRFIDGTFPARGAIAYLVAFLAYGVATIVIQALPHRRVRVPQSLPVVLTAIESVAAVAMNAITVSYLHGTGAGVGLLVIPAAQLPYLVPPRVVWGWLAMQTVAWTVVVSSPANLAESMAFALAVGAFEAFAAASSFLAISEGRARHNLAKVNAELEATRSQLAESSRAEERLRIARDVHDTLGHHLTALSLQLDVASRLAEGAAADHLLQAHAITRLLLSDVRDVVSRTRDTRAVDLSTALGALAGSIGGLEILVDLPAGVAVSDPGQADAIVKAAQEIVTNTLRHADARTLTIRLAAGPDALVLVARDDGSGAARVKWGNGLTGMRERLQHFGGAVEVHTTPGHGFEVRAVMPVRSRA